MPLSRSQLQRALEQLQASWAHGIAHLMEGDLPKPGR
jgi:hypothetical protein